MPYCLSVMPDEATRCPTASQSFGAEKPWPTPSLKVIARIKSDFTQKFGIPRQSSLGRTAFHRGI